MNSTLWIWLMGGLGNQLFMIFAVMSYAIDHKIAYKFVSHVDKTMDGKRKTYWDNLLDQLKTDYGLPRRQMMKYDEPQHTYQPLPEEFATGEWLVEGYFQSYKYFENNYTRILDILDFPNKIAAVKNKYGEYFDSGKKNIVIHFRLDDYLGLQAYHCIKKPDYYIHAIRALQGDLRKRGDDIGNYNILYFCQQNDDQIVEQFLQIIKDTSRGIPELRDVTYNFRRIPDDIPDWEQMLLMTSCDHFIIGNSTFSWWGAFMSEKADKLVYYPRVWFGPALHDKKITDLCPPDWHMIDA